MVITTTITIKLINIFIIRLVSNVITTNIMIIIVEYSGMINPVWSKLSSTFKMLKNDDTMTVQNELF